MGNSLRIRDEAETVLRSWNLLEIERGAPPVIDFDCHPTSEVIARADSRLAVRAQLTNLVAAAQDSVDEQHLAKRLLASITYLDALLGLRAPLGDYIRITQGCSAVGWPDEYLDSVRETACAHLAGLGVAWNGDTARELQATEGELDPADAAATIQQYAQELEDKVRQAVGSSAPYELSVEHVDLDVYWAYWLDGAGSRVRMRINKRRASFTEVQARQFALHEILGHGLQCASYTQKCGTEDVSWLRMTSVHAQQQVLLEGLAQAMPLFILPHDERLIARVRLAHYMELARAQLHIAINMGTDISTCSKRAKQLVPFWTDENVGDMLSDRSADPLLRSYLWAYPAGIDWFVNLADNATAEEHRRVLHRSYQEPLTPNDLHALWPAGPAIGGSSPIAK